ncbi:glycosyltransferase [Ectobacillus funiculus]
MTFYNQLKTASAAGVKGVALWRLGTEDPAVWDVLENRGIDTLRHIKDSDSIYSYGKGNILRAVSSQEQGKRELILNDSDQISGEVYQSVPKSSEMERLGKAETKEVVLTFDDGPDPEYTTRILNILKQHHIKATFFVIGKNAMLNKDIVQRIYMEGHEIGNHTFSHRHTNSISYNQLKLELNASQRVIQGITGHSSLLYRPPYGYVDTPTVNQDFKRMLYTTEMGYLTVNYDIDSRDWEATSSKEIVNNVLQELPNGNVILLHDGGGDRSSTVEALPEIIETLQNKGYTFVTTSELMNTERNSVMPSVKEVERPLVEGFKIIIGNATSLNGVISLLLYTVLALSVLRVFILVYFALRHKGRAQLSRAGNDSFQPLVSVIIAAYNEEKVISRTVQSILKSDYQHYEIIVVDDGSQDRTFAIVSENFSSNERVHLIRKKNGGKSSALNRGIQKAKGDIIIAIDADTIISHKAMSLLVRHFIDKKVAAVSGNMRVGNMRNLLTISQHIEYVTGFNLEKRAFSFLNCVTVVPGAIGAWRKQVILECGGFTDDTLAEDTDMTLRILCQGYRVAIEENAYAYTEAPEGIRGFFKQRYRWTYGTLQCLWKHKRAIFSREQKSLGCIAIPNMLLFQYALPLVAPILDALAIFGALSGGIKKAALFYLGFFIIDLVICLFTFRLEKLSLKPLISLFLQRMFYRYIMPLVVWKSIYAAIKGTRVGWNKLQRSGNLEIGESVKRTG